MDSRIEFFSQWIGRLAYVNVLWLAFTVLGLVIFGISPATAAMFAVTQKWVAGKTDTPVFTTFWRFYRHRFLRTNFMGLILMVLGVILLYDLNFFLGRPGLVNQFLSNLILLFILFYFVILIYAFPVYVQFDLGIYRSLKNALLVGYHSPVKTILVLVALLMVIGLSIFVPPVFIFFLASGVALLLTRIASTTYPRIEELRNEG